MSLLQVRDLTVRFQTDTQDVSAVRGMNFDLAPGEVLALVGESGAGKSATAMAVVGLLPAHAQVTGSVRLHGKELLGLDDDGMSAIRGRGIGTVFQDPMSALTPVYTVGDQIAEALRVHQRLPRPAARARAVELMEMVGIKTPAARARAFPHELSGGERQRIVIAMAIANDPDLIICDEPTTALDVTVQQRILDLLQELVAEHAMALVLISHDLGVIAQNVEQLLVMYGGTVVESGMTDAVFAQRAHPYTRGLFAARPQLNTSNAGAHLPTIAGTVPELVDLPAGCPFAGRCSYTQSNCYTERPQPRMLKAPSLAAPASLASWRQPHLVRCLHEQALSAEATA